jgi:RNA polymerase sigma factor (sigma-70 family)
MRLLGMAKTLGRRSDPSDAGVSSHDAVRWVYQRHYLDLVRVAAMWLIDVPSSEDAVQDVLAHVSRTDATLSGVTDTYAYLRVSVANRARSIVRQRGAHGRAVDRLAGMADHMAAAAPPNTDSAIDPSLVDRIRRLPPRQRDVLILRFYLDWSVDQVAGELDITCGAVKSSTHKALGALRAYIRET